MVESSETLVFYDKQSNFFSEFKQQIFPVGFGHYVLEMAQN